MKQLYTIRRNMFLLPALMMRKANANNYFLMMGKWMQLFWYCRVVIVKCSSAGSSYKINIVFHLSLYIFHCTQNSGSNQSHVMLVSAAPWTSGKYTCEVSADAPSFHTEVATKDLEVVGKFQTNTYYYCSVLCMQNILSRWHSIWLYYARSLSTKFAYLFIFIIHHANQLVVI